MRPGPVERQGRPRFRGVLAEPPTAAAPSARPLGTGTMPAPLLLPRPQGREKIGLVNAFVEMGLHAIISDVDTAWVQDPIPYMERYPDADILASSDKVHNTDPSEALEPLNESAGLGNIGIMLFRPGTAGFAKVTHGVLLAGGRGPTRRPRLRRPSQSLHAGV